MYTISSSFVPRKIGAIMRLVPIKGDYAKQGALINLNQTATEMISFLEQAPNTKSALIEHFKTQFQMTGDDVDILSQSFDDLVSMGILEQVIL